MDKVITFSDSSYFKNGSLFLKTRNRIKADFVLYGPDLTNEQITILHENNIKHKRIEQKLFDEKMQFLKFFLLKKEIIETVDTPNDNGITFVDFDTFFLRNWNTIYREDFSLGVTVRNDYVKKKLYRAFANGGVVFAKYSDKSVEMCDYAMQVMTGGGNENLIEYDEIYKTLENGRPAHKTHSRETLRWWVDQVFLSSLVLRYFKQTKVKSIKKRVFYSFAEHNIGLFNCDFYNKLDPTKKDCHSKKIFILHLKQKGRDIIQKLSKELKK